MTCSGLNFNFTIHVHLNCSPSVVLFICIRRRGAVQINDVTQFAVCCRPNMTHTNCWLYLMYCQIWNLLFATCDGTTVLYNGTTLLYNSTNVLYNGTTILYNGTTVLYDGTTVLYNGTTVLYNGTTYCKRYNCTVQRYNCTVNNLKTQIWWVFRFTLRPLYLPYPLYSRNGIAQLTRLLATGWTVRGSNLGVCEFFRTRSHQTWGPSILLCNGYRVYWW